MSIGDSKGRFNTFFRDDLYGRFDDPSNTILSRGAWNDEAIRYPRMFEFCTSYAFGKKWAGYSSSLGHERTLRALELMLNENAGRHAYTQKNLAITLGNTITISSVFKTLSRVIPQLRVGAFTPYYSPLLKSIQDYTPVPVSFVNVFESETHVLSRFEILFRDAGVNVVFVNNFIGVEGRTFSESFWSQLIALAELWDAYLVIDEALWFDVLQYPAEIDSRCVIRVCTLSKKYGIPGCKIGFLVGDEHFVHLYYETASSSYGGPVSIFFMLAEFVFTFEWAMHQVSPRDALKELTLHYTIPTSEMNELFDDFKTALAQNKSHFERNVAHLKFWLHANTDLFEDVQYYGGINCFIKPRTRVRAYDIFLGLITRRKTSILPSACLGDSTDSYMRITLLESEKEFLSGLGAISAELEQVTSEALAGENALAFAT